MRLARVGGMNRGREASQLRKLAPPYFPSQAGQPSHSLGAQRAWER